MLRCFIILVFFSVVTSCSAPEENYSLLNAQWSGLQASYQLAANDFRAAKNNLEDKLKDPLTRSKAEYWYSKLATLSLLGDRADSLLVRAEKVLAGKDIHPAKEKINWPQVVSSRARISSNDFQQLYAVLDLTAKEMLALDSNVSAAMMPFNFVTAAYGTSMPSFEEFRLLFGDIKPQHALVFIQQVRNNLRLRQARIAILFQELCHRPIFCGFAERPLPWVEQNSSVFETGDTLRITTGIVSARDYFQPNVSIRGKAIPIGPYGYSVFSKKITAKPGRYSVPVHMVFNDQDGNEQTLTKDVEYRVVACAVDSTQL
jgi:hypothetical protein